MLGHGHGHIVEGASAEKFCIGILLTWSQRSIVWKFTKCEIAKALYAQALGHDHGHIMEGASAEKLCIKILEITT